MRTKKLLLIQFLFLAKLSLSGQDLTQTIRGRVIDIDGKFPLIGATVNLNFGGISSSTFTDTNGSFKFEEIPIGRHNLKISYVGYESKTLPNLELTSGKEIVLEIQMLESLNEMNAVIVKANKNKGEVSNDMSLISSRSVTVDETQRYAGSFNDPARMVSSFAGVTANPEGNNDIVVRGNSPKYIQWRLEGIEIPNPNHFGDVGGTGGPISALNSNLLANSDFYTGAFSPEYGDVLSGIFDVKFRTGNNEKSEYAFGIGALGIDATLEGPFKKGYAGSYLFNYRYSSLALLDNLKLVDFGGIPKYQDGAFKIHLPTERIGSFSLFGLMGKSSITENYDFEEQVSLTGNTVFQSTTKAIFQLNNNLYTSGLRHIYSINKKSYVETMVSYSGSSINEDEKENLSGFILNMAGESLRDSSTNSYETYYTKIINRAFRTSIRFSSKLNQKHKIELGSKYILQANDFNEKYALQKAKPLFTSIDFKNNLWSIRNYAAWKFRLNEAITFVSGLHHFHVPLTGENSVEPRISMRWSLKSGGTFNAGYGRHSTMENVSNYYAKVQNDAGGITEPNKDLLLLKANHLVLGYEKRFTQNLMGKLEVYYQGLDHLPVKNDPASHYSTINETEGFPNIALVSKGTGQNYGIEFTLERFFVNNFYYMFTSSVYQSKYKSLENVLRNTRYNGNYAFNALIGKEFVNLGRKRNKTIGLNAKLFYVGARKIIPLLRDEQGNLKVDLENDRYYDASKAYEYGLDDVFQINTSASLKINKSKSTHEFAIDIINTNNSQARLYEYYDRNVEGNIEYGRPLSFLPNIVYRVHF